MRLQDWNVKANLKKRVVDQLNVDHILKWLHFDPSLVIEFLYKL